jgi:hypothetical protein
MLSIFCFGNGDAQQPPLQMEEKGGKGASMALFLFFLLSIWVLLKLQVQVIYFTN